jgi:hypothetical protein
VYREREQRKTGEGAITNLHRNCFASPRERDGAMRNFE